MYVQHESFPRFWLINSTWSSERQSQQYHTILTKHCKLFMGTGNLKNTQVKLEIDESVTPVAQPPRRIPHSMKSKVNSNLEEMRNKGIIAKVQGATRWLSPLIAIPKKNGDVRLVLDMQMPNTTLTRHGYKFPQLTRSFNKWNVRSYSPKLISLKVIIIIIPATYIGRRITLYHFLHLLMACIVSLAS